MQLRRSYGGIRASPLNPGFGRAVLSGMRCNNCGGSEFTAAEYVMPAAGRRLTIPQCMECGVFALGTTQLMLGEEERRAQRRTGE